MPEPTVLVFDPETKQVLSMPVRELADTMVPVHLTGSKDIVYMERSLLKAGAVRPIVWPPHLVERVRKFAVVLAEVLPDPLQKWLDELSRDSDEHLQSEVKIWETIAGKYLLFTDGSDAPQRKKEVAAALIMCTENSPEVVKLTFHAKTLSKDELTAICDSWNENLK